MALTLKIANIFFCATPLLMMMHHHTKFGNKMCSGSEDIISQTSTDILNLCCDLDLEHSYQNFPQDALAHDSVLPNQVWLWTDQQFRRYSRKKLLFFQRERKKEWSYFVYMSPCCNLDIVDSEPSFLQDIIWNYGCNWHGTYRTWFLMISFFSNDAV